MASNEIEIIDPTTTVEKLKKIVAGRALNRRRFLASLSMTGAAAGAGLLSGCSTTNTVTAVTTSTAQIDALNFVLNFKYLEATFYAFITTGGDLPSSSTVSSGAVTNAPGKLVFTGNNAQQITDMLNEIYYDEKSHVATLITLLGSAYAFRPAINLGAYAAITATNALSIARLLEDVGATAMVGASAALTNSNLTLVSQILGIESCHAGMLRLVSIQNPTIAAYAKADSLDVLPADVAAVTPPVGPGATGGFFATAGATTSSATNPAGMAFTRTSSQVLAIAYGSNGTPAASGATSGGFFPSGVSGNIKTV
jgi:hypothetical protein